MILRGGRPNYNRFVYSDLGDLWLVLIRYSVGRSTFEIRHLRLISVIRVIRGSFRQVVSPLKK